MYNIEDLTEQARRSGASDIHLVCGLPPKYRLDGQLENMEEERLSEKDCDILCQDLAKDAMYEKLEYTGELDFSREIRGIRCRCHVFKQQGKVDDFAVRTFSAISVNVLSQQSDFLYALSSKLRDFNEDVFDGTRELFTACIRHDTVGAVLAAAFHNGNECCSCIGMRSRQMVKFFDFRETDIDLRTMLFFVLFQEFRKTMEGLRSEDHVDVGSTANDVAAFLTGNAAAHGNLKIRLCLFQFSDSSEVGKYFFLSLFSNRACIKNN